MTETSASPPPDDVETLTVLLIEHRSADARLVLQALQTPQGRFQVTLQRGLAAGLERLRESSPDAIILDADLPQGNLAAVEEIRAIAPALPLIVLSNDDSGDNGIQAMSVGAQDYLIKGRMDPAVLGRAVSQAIIRQRLRMELAERLREIENMHVRLRNIIDMNLDGILVVGHGGEIRFANRAAKQVMSEKGGELLGEYLSHPASSLDGMALTLSDTDDRPRRIHLRIYPAGWGDEEAFMVLLREPLPGETRGEQRRIAQYDREPITGLFNRDAFFSHGRELLHSAGRRGASAAMLCLNLERFRRINQALGHAAGDAVLKLVAERLKRELRAGDLLGSFGSDEFAVLLTSLRRARDASIVAGKLLDVVALPIEHESGEVCVNARVGISLFPRDGGDISELVGHAQIAAERAKRWQPHRIAYYTAGLASQTVRRFHLEQNLRQALTKRQFKLLYQPIADVRDKKPVAAEALLRWSPDTDSVIPAKEFIPILEEIGLIDEVGEWVIRTACGQARAWYDAGHAIPVSVNLSPLQFSSERLLEKIEDALKDSGLPSKYLWIEVTESTLMQSLEESIDTLGQLRTMGVSVCIDDFGTGFSSLTHLKRFPIDTLKIDSGFVHDIVKGAKDAAIARNIVQLAHALNLTVVAEGVESDGQIQRLREYGCDFYQGHLYHAPLTPDELRRLITRTKRGEKTL